MNLSDWSSLVSLETRNVEAMTSRIVEDHPCVGFAVGVIQGDSLDYFHAHGLADIAQRTPLTAESVFRIASITKTFTAIAAMQLWEQGLVDLDAPVNDYLTSYRLVPAGPDHRPATLRHLLTHTAGLPELAHPSGVFAPDFGESVPVGDPIPSLADFYGGELRLRAEPGKRFVYGNHSPATVGQLVEDVTGQTLSDYFREHIFTPLGMNDSDAARTERIAGELATGYEIGTRGVRRVRERDMVTAGAASVFSSPRDMARYVAALIGGGEYEDGVILRRDTMTTMFAAHYTPDPRIPGLGLAFYRYDLDGRVAIGHQGTLPGFHSQIVAVPEDGVGVMMFTNGSRQADFWLPGAALGMLRSILGDPDNGRPIAPHRPEIWEDISGWYQLAAGLADVRLRGMIGAGVEVFVGGGSPRLRFLSPIPALYRGFELIPDDEKDPDVFRLELGEALEPMRVVFGRDPEGVVDRVYFGMMPLTLHKKSTASNPRRWIGGAVGVGALGAAVLVARRIPG